MFPGGAFQNQEDQKRKWGKYPDARPELEFHLAWAYIPAKEHWQYRQL